MRNLKASFIAAAVVATAAGTLPAIDPAPAVPSMAMTIEVAADAPPALPVVDNKRVDYWIKRFTTDQRSSFAKYLERAKSFAPMIQSELDEREMPQDLMYLAMMESGFNPKATSPAKAKGLWQFIEATAERYGLTVNRKVDERTDPVKSTEAALTYLGDLYNRFGSWYLAAAAYNTGENRVARLMREATGSERGSEEDYYAISPKLPQETRDYVPKIVAAATIAKEPAKYGFEEDKS
jgi:membrane-bound lytic murein transglycosylase D